MTTDALSSQFGSRFSIRWIVNPRVDLLWFIGGALAAYALLFAHARFQVDMIAVWFAWVVVLDSPHFFATISRTYMDREEMMGRKRLLLSSLLWFAAGPAVIGLSWLLMQAGVASYRSAWTTFLLLFNIWAYWHVVRQHFGFLRLYERKGGETDPVDLRIDALLLDARSPPLDVEAEVRRRERDELAPLDDAVIGRAFRWSFVAFVTLALLGGGLYLALKPKAPPPARRVTQLAAPTVPHSIASASPLRTSTAPISVVRVLTSACASERDTPLRRASW